MSVGGQELDFKLSDWLLRKRSWDLWREGEEEKATKLMMSFPRVEKRKVENGRVDYVGKGMMISGVGEGSVSEIEWGLLALYDKNGEVGGVVVAHPDKRDVKVVEVSEVGKELFGGRELKDWDKDGERFVEDLDEYWSEDGGMFLKIVDENLRKYEEKIEREYGVMEEWHVNQLGLEAKYYLWQLMQDEEGKELIKKITERFGFYGLRAVQVLEGNREYLSKLVRVFDRLGNKGEWFRRMVGGLPMSLFEGDAFVVEFGMMASQESGRYQQAVDFLLPRWRKMAKEIIDGLNETDEVNEFVEMVEFGMKAGNAWMGFAAGLNAILRNEEIELPRLNQEWWERMMGYIQKYPEKESMLEMLANFWSVTEIWWGRHVDVEVKREWLRRFYEHVVFKVGIYDGKVAKEAFADEADKERMVLKGLLVGELDRLKKEGGKDYEPRVLFLGVGNGMRVEGPVVEKLKEEGYKLKVVGVDMLDLEGRGVKIHPEFEGRLVQGRLENLKENLDDEVGDGFDVVVMWGTANLNMTLLREQLRYFSKVAEVLREGGRLIYQIIIPEFDYLNNQHYGDMIKSFKDGVREIGFGDRWVNPHYVRGFANEGVVGARFFPLWVWQEVWRASGLDIVEFGWDYLRRLSQGEELNENGLLVWGDGRGGSLVMVGEKIENRVFNPLTQLNLS